MRLYNLAHLDVSIAIESKRTESACCAVLGKTLGKENVLTASAPQKSRALSSAVCMNIDQRALGNGSVVVVNVADSHIQRIDLATEETTVIQQVSHGLIKCQSRS